MCIFLVCSPFVDWFLYVESAKFTYEVLKLKHEAWLLQVCCSQTENWSVKESSQRNHSKSSERKRIYGGKRFCHGMIYVYNPEKKNIQNQSGKLFS